MNSLFVIPGVFPLKISPYDIMNCCEVHLKFIIICLLTNTSPKYDLILINSSTD